MKKRLFYLLVIIFVSFHMFGGAKVYKTPDGKELKQSNVFDFGILLDTIASGMQLSQEEDVVIEYKVAPSLTRKIPFFVASEEAFIASVPLIRNIFRLSGRKEFKLEDVDVDVSKTFKDVEDALLKQDGDWLVYMTSDYQFVIAIPKTKYPGVQSKKDVIALGLNPQGLLDIFDPVDLKKQKFIGDRGIVSSLLSMFSTTEEAVRVNKRIFLNGHGSENGLSIAGLSTDAYRKLRGQTQKEKEQYDDYQSGLDKLGCSFLFISSCFAGTYAYAQLTFAGDDQTRDAPIKSLSSKRFIEVVKGTPGKSTYSPELNFQDFFYRINNFFQYIRGETEQSLEKRKNEYTFDEAFTEQQMFIGDIKLTDIKTKKILRFKPIIRRYPNIKESKLFTIIFDNFLADLGISEGVPVNTVSCRFPADTQMSPIVSIVPEKWRMEIRRLFQKDQKKTVKKIAQEKLYEDILSAKQNSDLYEMQRIIEQEKDNLLFKIPFFVSQLKGLKRDRDALIDRAIESSDIKQITNLLDVFVADKGKMFSREEFGKRFDQLSNRRFEVLRNNAQKELIENANKIRFLADLFKTTYKEIESLINQVTTDQDVSIEILDILLKKVQGYIDLLQDQPFKEIFADKLTQLEKARDALIEKAMNFKTPIGVLTIKTMMDAFRIDPLFNKNLYYKKKLPELRKKRNELIENIMRGKSIAAISNVINMFETSQLFDAVFFKNKLKELKARKEFLLQRKKIK